jgi:molybdate transport system ATP-binding protein
VLETTVAGHDADYGLTQLSYGNGTIRVPRLDLAVGAHVRVRIRARDVMIAVTPPKGLSALNILPGEIAEIGPEEGPIRDLRVALGGGTFLVARVTSRSLAELFLTPGRAVFAVIKSVALDRQSLGIGRTRHGDGEFVESEEE